MFGIYRYILAFCVAISHLWSGMLGGPAAYSVWGFYCLSGYLMTLVLNEKYGFSPRGLVAFVRNRALRIYPAYYATCAIMIALYLTIPHTASGFLPQLQMPNTKEGWLFSLTLLTQPVQGLVHGSSALRVELWMYILMALGASRSRTTTLVWFTACVVNTFWLVKTDVGFAERYVWIVPCSLAFSAGALFYHLKGFLPVLTNPLWAVFGAALWWAHVWLSQHIPGGPWIYGLYSSLAVSVVTMLTLINLRAKAQPQWLQRLDKLLGDLSYPVYLCHWAVGIGVVYLFPQLNRDNVKVFLIGFPVVNLLAYAIYRVVEAPLIRKKAPPQLTALGKESLSSVSGGQKRAA